VHIAFSWEKGISEPYGVDPNVETILDSSNDVVRKVLVRMILKAVAP